MDSRNEKGIHAVDMVRKKEMNIGFAGQAVLSALAETNVDSIQGFKV